MDQACFLLRAYVPRYTAETREAYDASCDVFISVGYFCSWYKSTLSGHVFRLLSLSSLSRFLLLSVAHFDRQPSSCDHYYSLPTRDPMLAIIAMGFLSTSIVTGSSNRITMPRISYASAEFNLLPAEHKCIHH